MLEKKLNLLKKIPYFFYTQDNYLTKKHNKIKYYYNYYFFYNIFYCIFNFRPNNVISKKSNFFPFSLFFSVDGILACGASSCSSSSLSNPGNSNCQTSPPPPPPQSLIRDYWYELKFSDLFKFINADGRYQCPRYNCLKSYKDASSLQRHIR